MFFHIANVGDTTGTIIRSAIAVELIAPGTLLLHPIVDDRDDLGRIELPPGAAKVIKFAGSTPKWQVHKFVLKSYPTASGQFIERRDAAVHLIGHLLYVDAAGTPRHTAFRRELIPERQRFYRIPNEPDLDYSD